MGDLKILLVEDHRRSRHALRLFLESAGYHVVAAATVQDGVSKIDGQAFALLDLYLPDGPGTDVCRALRERAPHTKVAFITAADDPERAIRTAGQLPDAVFAKPLDIGKLMAWLRQDQTPPPPAAPPRPDQGNRQVATSPV